MKKIIWFLISIAGAIAFSFIALARDESINAIWFIVAAICIYLIAYRFYSAWIAAKALVIDSSKITPSVRNNDGKDFIPTDKWIVMDLAQAEAIADLIDAASSQSARSALRSLQGEFSNLIGELVKQMIDVRVYVEAAIDFPEEEIDFLADNTLKENLYGLVESLLQIQDRAQQGALLRDGIKVVLAGKPNAGKSSLLNALAEQDAAIVTPVAGTTRDVLREQIHLEGVPLNIVDTAGLRETDDQVEMQGVQRAWKEIEEADAILYVVDITANNPIDIKMLWPEYFERFPNADQTIITLLNKVDLCDDPDIKNTPNSVIRLSAKTGQGLDMLKSQLLSSAGFNTSSEGVFSARRRHLSAIANALELLRTGINQLEGSGAGELLAEDLRQAQQYLSEITGDFSSDDLLGEIFSSFCIGK